LGAYNDELIKTAVRAGYSALFTIEPGGNESVVTCFACGGIRSAASYVALTILQRSSRVVTRNIASSVTLKDDLLRLPLTRRDKGVKVSLRIDCFEARPLGRSLRSGSKVEVSFASEDVRFQTHSGYPVVAPDVCKAPLADIGLL